MLSNAWYRKRKSFLVWSLLPCSWLFALVIKIRWLAYQWGLLSAKRFAVPVIVVGNITVGGTGKTPLVIWLANWLRNKGYRPGIVSRGVGGKKHDQPYRVPANADPAEVGDEAILLMRGANCPVVLSINRPAAVQTLLEQTDCNIVISDDGLQHYALARDIEIAVIDGVRHFGNGCLLPAGPLREPISRLHRAGIVVVNGEDNKLTSFTMSLQPSAIMSLKNSANQQDPQHFPHKKVHAVAAIGHPERFFATLKQLGFDLITHVFPDHYLYQAKDFHFPDDLPIIMTEKDAIKCLKFADERFWYLPVHVQVNSQFEKALLLQLEVQHEYARPIVKRACYVNDPIQHDDIG